MKIILVAAALALIPLSATAQDYKFQPSCIKNLTHVAKRLGVRPTKEGSLLVATGCDQRQYDIVALIDALLNKMDKAAKK